MDADVRRYRRCSRLPNDHVVGDHQHGAQQVGLVVQRGPRRVEHAHGVDGIVEHAHAVGAGVLHRVVDGGGEQAEGALGAEGVEVLDDAERRGVERLAVAPHLGADVVGAGLVVHDVHLQLHRLLALGGHAGAERALRGAVLVPREGQHHLGVVAAHADGGLAVAHVEPQRHGPGAHGEGALDAALEEDVQALVLAEPLHPLVGVRALALRAHLVGDERRPFAADAARGAQRELLALVAAPVHAKVPLLVERVRRGVPLVPRLDVRAHVRRHGVPA